MDKKKTSKKKPSETKKEPKKEKKSIITRISPFTNFEGGVSEEEAAEKLLKEKALANEEKKKFHYSIIPLLTAIIVLGALYGAYYAYTNQEVIKETIFSEEATNNKIALLNETCGPQITKRTIYEAHKKHLLTNQEDVHTMCIAVCQYRNEEYEEVKEATGGIKTPILTCTCKLKNNNEQTYYYDLANGLNLANYYEDKDKECIQKYNKQQEQTTIQ